LKPYNCKKCGRKTETDIEALENSKLCFTHFRWGEGKKIFEKGDLFT